MAKLRHIAIATQHEEETARFYVEVFGLAEVGKFNNPIVSGYFLTDGTINLAILHFKTDQVAGVERGKKWSGIHHLGFEVESLEESTQKLAAAGCSPRDDINQALGLGLGGGRHGNAEVRYSGPDGVMFDVSQTGSSVEAAHRAVAGLGTGLGIFCGVPRTRRQPPAMSLGKAARVLTVGELLLLRPQGFRPPPRTEIPTGQTPFPHCGRVIHRQSSD